MSTENNTQAVAIGAKIRAVRQSKKLSLQDLGDRVGLSRSFLSQMESGTSNPSIGSLKHIANALEITLAEIFDDDPAPKVADGHDLETSSKTKVEIVRADHRKRLVWPGADGTEYLLTPDLHRKLQVQLAVMEPGHSSGDPYAHPTEDGEEFGFIIEGTLEVTVGGEASVLNAGDSIYFPSNVLHHMRVVGPTTVRALWVMTPPSF